MTEFALSVGSVIVALVIFEAIFFVVDHIAGYRGDR